MSIYKSILNPFTGQLQLVIDSTIFQLKEAVASQANLPLTGNFENDVRITKDTDLMYTWSIALSSGTLDKWLQIGSASSVDWSALTNKPSASVSDIDDAVSKKHTQNTDTKLDEGGANEISAEQLKELSLVQSSALGILADIEAKLQLPYTVLHTDTDPDSLNTIIQSLEDGDILEVNSSATYNPISIPANKELIIKSALGKCILLTGTECIKLMDGARDTIISGVSISNCTSPAGNERGAGISFGEHNTIVSNISFYNSSIDTVTNGSGVMLSYHWTVDGDTYFTPNTVEECSTDVRFINCCFFDANKDNIEGGALAIRGIIRPFIYNCHFRDNTHSMRQLSLQNCISAYLYGNNIRNTATPGTNSEGIKLDDLGSCSFRTTAHVINNVIKNAIEGIDIDDNVTAFVMDNICYECTEEGISVDDSGIAVLARNLCYNCHYDSNSAGIRVEAGAVVSLYQNNCVNNSINYRIQNGYSLPAGNGISVDDIILKDSSKNLVYDGSIPDSYNIHDALETLYELIEAPVFSNMIYVDVNGNDTTGTGTITKPFASIYKAMLSITDATPTQRYAIKVGVGFFTETENIVHKPNVWIIGENTYSTRVIFSGTYSLDASFSGTADNRFGFYGIFIDGVMDWNFLTVTATNARMYNRSCQFNKAISFTAYQSTTRCYMFDCETYSTFSITGGSSWYHNCSFNGRITVYSDANSANQFFISSTLTNGLTVNCSGTQYSDVWLVNSQIRSTLVTIGWAGLHYSFGCLPPKAWRTISAETTASSLGNETITDMLFSRTVAGFPTYYATNKDYIVAVTNTSAPSTIYLPSLSSMNDGACIIIKDETGLASANNITINRSSTNTIEGATSIVINNNYGVVVLYKASASMWVKLSTSTASSIQNTPAGNILAKDVQGAINELDTEKISKNSISGSFTTVDGKTITVVDGQITAIS